MRTTRTTIPRLGTLLVAVGCALAACGGSDEGGDAAESPGDEPRAQAEDDSNVGGAEADEVEETAAGFSTGDGGGTVTIDGVAYGFDADICIAQGPSFVAGGLAEAPDGTPAWVSISHEADGFDIDGDGEGDATLDVNVEVGRAELFGSGGDDQPDWTASKVDAATLSIGEDLTVGFDGNNIAGSGSITDFNGVGVPFGETAPMAFEASCS